MPETVTAFFFESDNLSRYQTRSKMLERKHSEDLRLRIFEFRRKVKIKIERKYSEEFRLRIFEFIGKKFERKYSEEFRVNRKTNRKYSAFEKSSVNIVHRVVYNILLDSHGRPNEPTDRRDANLLRRLR